MHSSSHAFVASKRSVIYGVAVLAEVETPTGVEPEAAVSSFAGAGVEAAIVILKLGSEALGYPPEPEWEEEDDCGRLKRAANGFPPEEPPPKLRSGLPPVNGERRPFNKFSLVLMAVCANWK